MNHATFATGAALAVYCTEERISFAEAMLRREMELSGSAEDELRAEMYKNLVTMRASIQKGLSEKMESVSGLSGGDATRLFRYAQRRGSFCGVNTCRAVASSMAVVEVNAAMGLIVAAPTAGASGILPGVLVECGQANGWTDAQLVDGLFTAGAIGLLFSKNATVSGADGGCQAETGVAAAMAAGALVEISGGSPHQVLDAAAMAIKNVLGLICDPVAGLVECPCIKRNALGACNAMLCADMALCGITSLIPFDEVVDTMRIVGHDIRSEYRETARGGLAATPTGKEVAKRVRRNLGRRD
ncbi:MAG: L-serine ammonia-lyase, iron-sulfur-dependent, subunit alpha [Clostridiales bacterium]|nr:L-serine ammonia-lyase, iron-sulfur-dependent, subunit alpha [Clostridiales bacterium]